MNHETTTLRFYLVILFLIFDFYNKTVQIKKAKGRSPLFLLILILIFIFQLFCNENRNRNA